MTTTPVSCVAALKSFACEIAFWPVVPSRTSSVSAGGRADLALDHAPHLLQLFHQVGFGLQPAGGIDEHHVGAARFRRAHAVEHDRRRIGAFGAAHDLAAAALGPNRELLGRRGAKRVGRDEQHAFAFARKRVASLPIVVVLPLPLTPTTRMTAGLRVEVAAPRPAA